MELIYERGLNCYLASLVSIAHALGVNYPDAFATLWSETVFTDEPVYNVYSSKRVYDNLEALGVVSRMLDCTAPQDTEESLSELDSHELFLVGMDRFDTPWSPVYGHFYGPHFFIARKESADSAYCFDPVYDKRFVSISIRHIIEHANALYRVHKSVNTGWRPEPAGEARAIADGHAQTRKNLIGEILRCKGGGRQKISPVIKQIDAMLNNRYLFRRYLNQVRMDVKPCQEIFTTLFLGQWEAIKNGLYKASVMKNNEAVIDEVCALFAHVMEGELAMAARML